MHRSILVPRALIICLVSAWLLSGGLAHAQAPGVKPLVVQIGTTQTIETASRLPVLEIRESNPKVARAVPGPSPNLILITGLAPGTSSVTITDVKKNVEVFDVIVATDDRLRIEAQRREFLRTVKQVFPTANIDIAPAGVNTFVLTGTLQNAEDSPRIIEVAKGHFGIASIIVNQMRLGGVQMVQLHVVVARVNRSEARNMSFSFLFNYRNGPDSFTIGSVLRPSTLTNGATLASATAAAATQFATTGGNIPISIITDKTTTTAFLEALRTEGLAKIVAEPTITTLSGKPAQIVSGGETPILTSSGTGAPSVQYKAFGTRVDFLPIVLGNGKIHLEVRPELSALNAANGINIPGAVVTVVPGFDTRSAVASVQMEDGQTVAIGGLIQNTVNGVANKVPILGDIPWIGAAFRQVTYTEAEEELLILVTPRLVDPMNCAQMPKYLPGRETRTPDDFELFLEGILEAPRGPREVGLLTGGAHMQDGSPYPCGDSCEGRGHLGRGGRCLIPGCRSCQSATHVPSSVGAQPVNYGKLSIRHTPTMPVEQKAAPTTRSNDPVFVPLPVPEVKELTPAITPVTTSLVTPVVSPTVPTAPPASAPQASALPRETPGWGPPPVTTPTQMVPPVSELRRDLNQ